MLYINSIPGLISVRQQGHFHTQGASEQGQDPVGNVKEFALLLKNEKLLEGFGERRFRFAF